MLWRLIDASVEFNVQKRKDYLTRENMRELEKRMVQNNKKSMQSADDKVRAANQKMLRFFSQNKQKQSTGKNDKFHWSKSGQWTEDCRKIISKEPRFLLPRPR